MTHGEVRVQLGDYVEGDLPLARRALVDAHLDACDECAAILGQLRRTVDALHSLGAPEPPPGIAAAVLARIAAGEGQPGALARLAARIPWNVRTRLSTPAVVLVAAAVLFLWLRPASEQGRPGAALPSARTTLKEGRPLGASVPPDPIPAEAVAGPIVPSEALARALQDPAAILRATETLGAEAQQAWLAALLQQAGSRSEVLALAQALRALPDPRSAALAEGVERLAPPADAP
jgi:anti-sigma factor RsiW